MRPHTEASGALLPITPLLSERLHLRQPEKEDASRLSALLMRERARLEAAGMTLWGGQDALAAVESFILTTAANRAAKIGFEYALFSSAEGNCVGSLSVQNIELSGRRCELGYWIGASYEGQGFATEAVLLLVSELFQVGFFRIEICADSENEASQRVAEKAGFRLDGILRGDTWRDGRFRSTAVWSRLATDPS